MLHSGMSSIQVKNVSESLHDAVRRRAAEEGVTMTDYILELLRRDLAVPSRRAWFQQVGTGEPVDVNVLETLDAVRAERDDELMGD